MKCISGPSLWSYHPEPSISGRSLSLTLGHQPSSWRVGVGDEAGRSRTPKRGQGHRSKLTLLVVGQGVGLVGPGRAFPWPIFIFLFRLQEHS